MPAAEICLRKDYRPGRKPDQSRASDPKRKCLRSVGRDFYDEAGVEDADEEITRAVKGETGRTLRDSGERQFAFRQGRS